MIAKILRVHSIRDIKSLGRQLESLLGGVGDNRANGVLQNVLWLSFDRGWRLLVGFAVGIAVARHLGPAGSGILMSGFALAALSATLVELGFEALLRRELVNADPIRRGELLGTVTAVRAATLPFAIAIFAAAYFLQPIGQTRPDLFVAFAFTVPLPLFLALDSWFQSQTQARYTVWAQNLTLLASVAARMFLLAKASDLSAFAWVAAAETLLTGALLAFFYHRSGQTFAKWRVKATTAKALWRDAWPFAIINLSALAYNRLDLVMLSTMRGEVEAGYYGAAIRLSETALILPMILTTSLLPTLTRLRSTDPTAYRDSVQRLCTLVTWVAIATAAFLSILAPWIVSLVYGPLFLPAASMLIISAWLAVFVSQSVARGQWLLLENLQRFALWYVVIGFATNVLLNLLLIPSFGGVGAAAAAVITHAVVALVAPALFAPTRPGVRFLLNAFLLRQKAAS